MQYRFDDFTLDAARFELRKGGETLPAEPQVLSLLLLLAENRERMVGKDELVEKIWGGRIVSDSAISSRVKSARQLLGDDGKAQRYLRTVHGKGFRFAGEVRLELPAAVAAAETEPAPPPQRPSIAVLPFGLLGAPGAYGAIADALPHELIAELSRLRWLFVIARGSSFRFRGPETDAVAAGRALGVAYCLSGQVEIAAGRLSITVELADTRDGSAIWGERYSGPLDDVHEIRGRIVASIVTALEIRIPAHEAERARLGGSGNLDAWAAYHLGLEQLYRYNRSDNSAARALFEQAVALDPAFARAHAAIGFTRFQEGFMRYGADADAPKLAARTAAERAIELDPLDPFVNHVMGRVAWLEGDLGGSLAWLDRATGLSPSYAQGVYVGGLARALTGAAEEALGNIELAVGLSPLDPLRYGMLSTRGIAHVLLGNHAEAVRWAEMGVHSPGAHKHIALVAAVAREMAGERDKASAWVAQARRMDPAIAAADFLRSFPFSDEAGRAIFADALASHGL
jgi:TolB-like protein